MNEADVDEAVSKGCATYIMLVFVAFGLGIAVGHFLW